MEYNEWLEVLSFINKLKEKGYLDACYIFYKMVVDKVFHFVCFSRQYGIEKGRRKKRYQEEILLPKKSNDESFVLLEDLLQSCSFVSNWTKKEKEYNKLKKFLIDRKLVDDGVKIEGNFIDELKKNVEVEGSNISEVDIVNIGDRRRALKHRKRTEAKKLSDGGTKPITLADYRNELFDAADREKERKEAEDDLAASGAQNSHKRRLNCRILYVNDGCSLEGNRNSVNSSENRSGGNSSNEGKNAADVASIKDMPNLFEGPSVSNSSFRDFDEESGSSSSESDSDEDFDMLVKNYLQSSKDKEVTDNL